MARKNPALKIAQDTAHRAVLDRDGQARPGLQRVLVRAVDVQRPLVVANLRRMRHRHPNETSAELQRRLERDYLALVTGTGAAVGGSAAVPGVGTAVSLGLSAAATVGFLEGTALFAASVAELHGIHLEDPERARTTVMAIMLGEEGTALLSAVTGHALGTGAGARGVWGAVINRSLPGPVARMVQRQVQERFLKWLLRKQTGAVLGRALPFGIGAVVGGMGNHAMGRAVVRSTRIAFGPAPLAISEAVPPIAPAGSRVGETPEQAVEREIEERRARLHPEAP
ncbi:hypothetical protein [Sinomonas sp. ASV322]|uniref:hypothetical protein n=1 Tax=Sinomonas sp. ASV322 TaxID=3041920 RepID=UPI0027DE1D8D|nr:hypothetical protein [Sinomonas sp. ASV322]MDQ4501325.1 hypothetical protein [Sinomonas sp. ASV322]